MFSDWSSPQWIPIGLGLGVLGIVLGLAFAWWFARGPSLVAQASGTTVIVAPGHNKITVAYDGDPVERVTQSVLWVWRRGRGVVKGSDVVQSDPVVLSVPEGHRFLEVVVVQQSRDTNNVKIGKMNERQWVVRFDYLDMRQGFAVEIYHTAPDPADVQVTGTVMGVPKGIKRLATGFHIPISVGTLGVTAVMTIPSSRVPWHLRSDNQRPTISFHSFFLDLMSAVVLSRRR